jgi:hypothetical protein
MEKSRGTFPGDLSPHQELFKQTSKYTMALQYLLCMNRQGKVRLAKYYTEFAVS